MELNYASSLVWRGRYIVFLVSNTFSSLVGVSYIIQKVFESKYIELHSEIESV